METYRRLYDIIKSAFETKNMTFSDADLFIDLTFANIDDAKQIESQISDFGIVRNNAQIKINCVSPNLSIFRDIEDYRKRIKLDDKNTFKTNILILNLAKDVYFYNKADDCCYVNFCRKEDCYLFSNTKHFFSLLTFLKQQEHKEDHHFYLVDYFNKDNRRIIITSPSKQGRLTIEYEQGIPDFSINTSIGVNIERFIDAFNQKQLPKFIKAELFNVIPTCEDKTKRLLYFIDHLPSILERAEQNFEIYLNDLSLDNFKKQFLDFRIKYFNLFRDILAKITTQVLAFPLSITAASFASYKVIDNELLAYSIVIAFVVFSIYSLFMLGAYKQDIIENKSLFLREYDELKKNVFFTKYPAELTYFESTNDFVLRRQKFLYRSIVIYAIVLSLSNSLFVFFVLYQHLCICWSGIISGLLFLFLLLICICQLKK
jgi:hypothetical protein